MNHEQEYEQFIAKLTKSAYDLQRDFGELSPENQQRVQRDLEPLLRGFGFAITIDTLRDAP